MRKQVDLVTHLADYAHHYAADGSGSDTYTITPDPAITDYVAGQIFQFKANTANTGAATLNVNAKGAKTIKKNYDQDLADNDIKAGQIVNVIYDGTNFQLLSPVSNTGAKFITGSYIGNGVAGRTITVGFRPSLLVIHSRKSTDGYTNYIYDNGGTSHNAYVFQNQSGINHYLANSDISGFSLSGTGFTLGVNEPNSNTVNYSWEAFA